MNRLSIIIVLIFSLISNSCEKEESPRVKFTNITDGLSIEKGKKQMIQAEIHDPDGVIVEANLYLNEVGVCPLEFPYEYELDTRNLIVGQHKLKLIAIDDDGNKKADRKTINIVKGVPVISTAEVVNYSATTAILGGVIENEDLLTISEKGVYLSKYSDPLQNGTKIVIADSSLQFSTEVTDLEAGTKYYVSAFAKNDKGESTGEEKSFVTSRGIRPVCKIITPVDSANIGRGEIVDIFVNAEDPDGNNLEVRYLLNANGIESMNTYPYKFKWNTDGYPDGDYYINVIAKDAQGLEKEDEVMVTLSVGKPIVKTNAVENISLTSAIVGGEILSNGGSGIIEAGVYYYEANDPEEKITILKFDIRDMSFSGTMTGLATNTNYVYKAYAANGEGLSFGEEKIFKTLGNEMGTFTDTRDNREYSWVRIGNQTWMAENLAYLPSVDPPDDASRIFPRYYIYNYHGNNVSEAKGTSSYQEYGVLYNWIAALNVCPAGWHLPTDDEWKTLEMTLGMSKIAAGNAGWRGGIEGRLMKAQEGWKNQGNGNNVSDFSAIPGGYRLADSTFKYQGIYSNWWTSKEFSTTNSWSRYLYYNHNGVNRITFHKEYGFSVRCIKD